MKKAFNSGSLIFTLLPFLFLISGIICLIGGFVFLHHYNEAYDVTAMVSSCKRTVHYDSEDGSKITKYKIYMDYTFDGEEYEEIYIYEKSDSVPLGKEMAIRIHPDNPEDPLLSSSHTGMFIAASLFIIIASAMPLAVFLFRKKFKTSNGFAKPESEIKKTDIVDFENTPDEPKNKIESKLEDIFALPFLLIVVLAFAVGSVVFLVLTFKISFLFLLGTFWSLYLAYLFWFVFTIFRSKKSHK